jgi:CSLREA domain-containing protein
MFLLHPSTVCAASILLAFASLDAAATTIVVNSTDDAVANDGHCTMREAIAAANNNVASGNMPGECAAGQPGPVVDTIAFNIPGSGVHTITPATSYAQIADIVLIDGYTQPGAHANTLSVGDDAVLLIAFDAPSLTDPLFYFHGSKFGGGESGGSTVRGLAIHHFDHAPAFGIGTGFGNGANNITLQGNFIGTGADDNSNAPPISCVSSTGLIVGGAAPAARNVITAGGSDGVELNQCSNGIVQGNYIGLSADGTAKFGNLFNGVEVIQGGNGNLIGGPNPGEGNVIAGTTQSAIKIDTSDGAIIQGNFLGTDASGTGPIGNPFGVILSTSTNTLIGGPGEGDGNVISGNDFGMRSDQALTTTIQGNAFGVDVAGSPLPNRASAILIASGSAISQGLIGGTAPGEGNVIANNCGAGVNIQNGVAQWTILGNSMSENSGLGIALQGGAGPTSNDPGDGDTGSNNLQNYPVLTAASVTAGTATLSGTFNSESAKQYRLEFFSSFECSKTGFGEGKTPLGFTNVITDGNGNASFGPLTFTGAPNNQTAFAATATDPAGNTSEFSMCVGGIGRIFASGFELQCP